MFQIFYKKDIVSTVKYYNITIITGKIMDVL